jgi:hypothetical protein
VPQSWHGHRVKNKVKQSSPTTGHADASGERYSSYSFLTSALDGVGGQRHAPAALYPRRKDSRYPLYRRLGGPQSRSGHRGYRKNPLPLPVIKSQSSSLQSDTILTELPQLLVI